MNVLSEVESKGTEAEPLTTPVVPSEVRLLTVVGLGPNVNVVGLGTVVMVPNPSAVYSFLVEDEDDDESAAPKDIEPIESCAVITSLKEVLLISGADDSDTEAS